MFALAVVIFIAFFLPWLSVESGQIGMVTKILTGKRQALVDNISAFNIPILANSTESRFMISIIRIFNPNIEHADKKSFLIWLVPIFALIIAVASRFLAGDLWFNIAVGLIGTAIFAVAVFKISTTDLDKFVLRVSVGLGLWLSIYTYLAMGLLSFAMAIQSLFKRNV
jgi:hypothetical protein